MKRRHHWSDEDNGRLFGIVMVASQLKTACYDWEEGWFKSLDGLRKYQKFLQNMAL